MPQIIETPVYRVDELDEAARHNARNWYRGTAFDDDWYASIFEDFETVCEILGITLRTHPVRLHGGGPRSAANIYFSGFSSQGDGACYEGTYRYAKASRRRIRDHAPKDTTLHGIADRLADAQRRNFYQLKASFRQTGRYTHEYSMMIAVDRGAFRDQDFSLADEDIVIEALRDLARWLYRQLEAEHDYQCADNQVDEGLRAGDFTFTRDGQHFG
ncbi:antitoxin of toxin-antitoxin stability system [Sphingomonas oryzagri]